MRQLFSFLLFVCFFAATLTTRAQQCNGSLGAPVINYTFGHGTTYGTAGALPSGITNMSYTSDVCGTNDGQYTITNVAAGSCKGGTWQGINADHTGDPYGYFMLINASYAPSVFYTQRIDASKLCPGATYYFGAWVANLLRDLPSTQGYIEPNITFSIEKLDGTPLITPFNSGNIKATDLLNWVQYGTLFTAPTDGSDFVIKMTNNAPGGDGNDLVLDDITFSPCGPLIQTGFTTIGNITTPSRCADANLNYTLVSKETGYNNPGYQWQYKIAPDTLWHNVTTAGATTATLPVNIPNASAGIYQYRVGILDGANTSENCRIYSDPLTITVYPYPVNTLAASTGGCVGYPLQLSATGGDTYQWKGPNGFTSTDSSPFVNYSATTADEGEYDVTITQNGCPTFAKTTVTVYTPPSVDPIIAPTGICAGSSYQLNATAHNATHYKWIPATGLDHDDIANPIATPTDTTTYTVTVSNDGCTTVQPTASVTINVWKKPIADAGQTIKIFAGQSAQLNGAAKGDLIHSFWTPASFLNNLSSLNPIATPPQDITYTLHVESDEGCGESTSTVFVRVYQLLGIPNTITPNGDGVNDKWEIKNINTYPNALISIYNRQGQPVFQSRGYGIAWDGTYNGKPLPVGTYYYVIDLQEDDLPKPAGWVLIVR